MLKSRSIAVLAASAVVLLPLARSASAQVDGLPLGTSSRAVDPNFKPTFTFDVATIRPAERGQRLSIGVDSPLHASHFQANGLTLRFLIQLAYGFGPIQVVGGPEWLDTDIYNVEAKSDHSVDEQLAKLTDGEARLEKVHMLQTLFADRLHLKTHWETREGRVFDLVLAKDGPKLQPTPVPTAEPGQPAPIAGALGPDIHISRDRRGREFDCSRFSTRSMTPLFAGLLETPVLDKTGLTGTYDFTLRFASQDSAASDPEAYPSLFNALQEQLGLKLEPSKGPIDTLVIDHVERPTEN